MKSKRAAATGVETLIIFIAIIMVAATAATVIITTGGKLQSTALTVGKQSQERVSDGVDIVRVVGWVNVSSSSIHTIELLIRPLASTDPIALEDVLLTVIADSGRNDAYYSNVSSKDDLSIGDAFMIDPAIGDSDEFLEHDEVLKVTLLLGDNYTIQEEEEVDIRFGSDESSYQVINFMVPSRLVQERLVLWPS